MDDRQAGDAAGDAAPLAPNPASVPQFFLRTKLLPPRPAPALLPRPRLYARLEQNLERAVTLVTANAGSGKTTLVADFLRTHATPHVWYQLDQTDADPSVFFGYLASGIRLVVPAFGQTTLAYVAESSAELARKPESAADVLLNELLESVDQRIVIVLDDYHHLGADTPVHRAVDRLIAYMPDLLHLVIVSRDMPPLALARRRTTAAADVIDRDELLFTDDETLDLFRRVFGLEITPEQLAIYRERTQGWITALQLVRQVVQRSAGDDVDLLRVLRQSERDIFDYFAEEVFEGETPAARELLLRLSVLERLEADVCAALFPDLDTAARLADLVRRNVFVTVAGDAVGEEFRFHPLFHGFLRRRLRTELGDARFMAEHRRCATYFAARQQWESATSHFLAAGDEAAAAEVLARSGPAWVAAGKLAALTELADRLPPSALAAHPRALLARAEVARVRGEHDSARALYRRAIPLLAGAGDHDGEAEALHALATIARRHGEFADAFALLDRAEALAGARSLIAAKCANTRGLCLLQTSRIADGERELRASLEIAEELGDDHYVRLIAHNLGGPAMVRGDFSEATRWLRRMLAAEPGAPSMPQEATGHLNIARCLLFCGKLDECEHHLALALERCQQFRLEGLVGEVLEYYGNLFRERLDFGRAADFYRRAIRAYEGSGTALWRREVLEEQAVLAFEMGDGASALAALDRLITERAEAGDETGATTATATRGRLLVALGEYSEATGGLEAALTFFHENGLYSYEAQTSLSLAACARALGDRKAMLARLRRALDLAARYDYDYWLRRETARNAALFEDSEAREMLPPDVAEILPRLVTPPGSPPVVVEPAAPAADLTVRLLGPVDIVRDPARPIPSDAWTTRRARDILCYLASRKGRRASKDTIVDTFWAETDFEAVEKNFHPTISHIRKALNRNQLIKQNFLVYRDGDYILNPDFTYQIDVETFDRLYEEAEAARRAGDRERRLALVEEALALYRGEFMPGSYEDWVEEQREHFSERRLLMLEAVARAASDAGDWPRALDLANAILHDDQYREDVHCLAMRAHAAMGNRGAVKDQYESLRKLLRNELGVDPDPETRRTYQDLLKS